MTRLSVNVNKVALLRNARGENIPDVHKVARDCEAFGAQGITVHPRPDERHIKYSDIPGLREQVQTELNIEGNPIDRFMDMVLKHQPHQCTLVPDDPGALTSDSGWNTIKHKNFLTDITNQLQDAGIRVSIFIDPIEKYVEGAAEIGAERVELYTGVYSDQYNKDRERAVQPHIRCAKKAREVGIDLNAGHDLNLDNLNYYTQQVTGLSEVSIGHALISDALYYGLENVIQMYLQKVSD